LIAKLFDPNNPNEKKKMIAAGALGLVALIVLAYARRLQANDKF
jgi:hypothetical protein